MEKKIFKITNHIKKIKFILIVLIALVIFVQSMYMNPQTVSASVTSLTLNKTATSDSYVLPYAPGKAVDGQATGTSRWYSASGTGDKWLAVDLGSTYSINRWVVKHLGNAGWGSECNTRDFRLQTSLNNIIWTDVDSVAGNTSNVTDRTVISFLGRYVRVIITKGNSSGNNWASIMEFEVYGSIPLTVTSVTVPTNKTYIAGENLDFTVNFNNNVVVNTVGGTPYMELALDNGGTVNASYISGSGTSSLTFRYTVAPGNLDLTGVGLGTTINVNSGTVKDSEGNDAILTLNSVSSTTGILVDASAVEITAFDGIGDLAAGTAGSATYANAAEVIAALPTTAKANSNAVTVPVATWVDTDSYNPAVAGSYTFTAALGAIPEGFANTGNYTATVEVVVTTQLNSTISPSIGSFDKNTSAQADVTTTMTLNGNTLINITNGGTSLVLNTNYTVSGDTVIIKKEYLALQDVGTTNFTFNFSAGNTQNLVITVGDTTEIASGVLLNTNPIITFINDNDFNGSTVTDGQGGTTAISDIDIQIISGNGYTWSYETPYNTASGIGAGYNDSLISNLITIKSHDSSNFNFKSFFVSDYGDTINIQNIKVAGYRDNDLIGSVNLNTVANSWENTFNQNNGLTPSIFDNVDEIRITPLDSGMWIALNNIQVGPPVESITEITAITSVPVAPSAPVNGVNLALPIVINSTTTPLTESLTPVWTLASGGTVGQAAVAGTNYTYTATFTAPAGYKFASVMSTGNATVSGDGSTIAYSFTVVATTFNGIVPDKPTNVTVSPSNGKVTVKFSEPFDGGSPITSYTVEVYEGGTKVKEVINILKTSTTISGLINGTTYTFKVIAINAIGASVPSDASNAVTPVTFPSLPRNVTWAPGDGQITINFDVPLSDGGLPIKGYTVTVNQGGIIVSGVASPIVVRGLTNGNKYTITIKAVNELGGSSVVTVKNVIPNTP